jgi:hypothetical protein
MESIFLSHHFDPQVDLLVGSIKRIIASHDLRIVDGHRLEGQQITNAVDERIRSSDAMIAILSHRDEGRTNNWVRHERTTAFNSKIPFIALIEEGLQDNGPFEAFEFIKYNPEDLVDVLLKVSETIFKWKIRLGELIEAHLEPEEIVDMVRSNLGNADTVKYRFFNRRNGWTDWKPALVKPQSGGISLLLDGINKNTEVQIQVTANNRIWTSDVINRNLRILVPC